MVKSIQKDIKITQSFAFISVKVVIQPFTAEDVTNFWEMTLDRDLQKTHNSIRDK